MSLTKVSSLAKKSVQPASLLLLLALISVTVNATVYLSKPYSPQASADYPQNLYWGDTHVHTTLSPDAYSLGTTLSPDNAYRFAKGETVTSNTGQTAKINRPLDFILLSDHAEFLGVFPLLDKKDPLFINTKLGKRWLAMYKNNQRMEAFNEFLDTLWGKRKFDYPKQVKQTIWQQVTAAADKHNQPGIFTAFIGFEWSSLPNGNNLHRNIVFRDDANKANLTIPFSSIDSSNPENLWQYLNGYEQMSNGKIMAIAHNGNVSNGLMFSDKNYDGKPLTQSYAKSRARWEPLYEVTQIKGDGEAHPYLSPDDAFADYETWDTSNLSIEQPPKEKWMLKHEYARSALKLGLQFEKTLGTNPFKFGMIGSSDSHTGLAAVEESNFWGKFGKDEPSATRAHENFRNTLITKNYSATGYTAVWATANTRAAIFDAMQRRETYASTGPRIMVRFFGGWNFQQGDDKRPNYVAAGYTNGVPMGGDLSQSPKNKSPRFLIVSSKDPNGANLDRIQVIKGWLNKSGEAQEQVYNVAVSGHRKIDQKNGKVNTIKSTVNIKTATYTNTVGGTQLSTVWEDPDFNSQQKAFYYVRVLEIPTPRWTTYDAAFYGNKLPKGVPAIHQERAYTSPIWYTP